MARTFIKDSATTQFFICVAPCDYLDGEYAAFGKVLSGQDIIDKIAETPTDYSDRPYENQTMTKVTVDTFGVDYPEPEKC